MFESLMKMSGLRALVVFASVVGILAPGYIGLSVYNVDLIYNLDFMKFSVLASAVSLPGILCGISVFINSSDLSPEEVKDDNNAAVLLLGSSIVNAIGFFALALFFVRTRSGENDSEYIENLYYFYIFASLAIAIYSGSKLNKKTKEKSRRESNRVNTESIENPSSKEARTI